jgi:hypothetical protein
MRKGLKILNIFIVLMFTATLSLAAEFGPNSAILTHNYFPMKLGDKLTHRSYGFSSVIEIYLEAQAVEVIDAVKCLKIYESGSSNYYWMAEGIEGNIWLLKEYDSFFNETSIYGKENAKLIYPKALSVGTILWQGLPERPIDTVIATGLTVPPLSTGLGPYYNCVKTEVDWGDGDIDYEYYAPDIGMVKTEFDDGGGINGFELKEIIYGIPGPSYFLNPAIPLILLDSSN